MMKPMAATAVICLAAPVFAGLYGDTPDARHAWAVHDKNRPAPVKVTADPGVPPSDAVVLFDGTKESFERNWCDKDGNPSKWQLGDEGDFYCVPQGWRNGGNIYTRGQFGDCQLHLEWRHDADIAKTFNGDPQMLGNSGVFLMGKYEIQVLESFGTNPADMKMPTYVDGIAGSVYGYNPPMVNACRRPGEWQTYDIIFHQPVWEGEKMKWPGSVTVILNGVVVQDHWELEGMATHCVRRPLLPHEKKAQFNFQDHGCIVHYRNIWIREIPSRYANTTHGGPAATPDDVMALRRKTAAALFAKIDVSRLNADTVNKLLEVVSYSQDKVYMDAAMSAAAAFGAKLDAMSAAELESNRGVLVTLRKSYDVLWRNGLLLDSVLGRKIEKIVDEKGWLKKKK